MVIKYTDNTLALCTNIEKKFERLCKIMGFASYNKKLFFLQFFSFVYSNKVEALTFLTIEVMLSIIFFTYKKNWPWKLKAPSQYCMTGGINTSENYWEHRRCDNDNIYGESTAKLAA